MKRFEVYKDNVVPPENFIVVRLDGVAFSKVTKRLALVKPFDDRFMDMMAQVVTFLMERVPDIEIGYVQSDEISLVFKRDTEFFSRRVEKLGSVLAGMASAEMTRLVGESVFFDGRLSVFPNREVVNDNLWWRIEDSVKNCRNLLVFWGLINQKGMNERQATKAMLRKTKAWYNEFLFTELGVNFDDVNPVYKRGRLLYRKEYEKQGWNPQKETFVTATRRALFTDVPPKSKTDLFKYIAQKEVD
jgi:tRNA(His) 5'-end guanylyltransferase